VLPEPFAVIRLFPNVSTVPLDSEMPTELFMMFVFERRTTGPPFSTATPTAFCESTHVSTLTSVVADDPGGDWATMPNEAFPEMLELLMVRTAPLEIEMP
jgi:hypothetical protein